MRENPTAAMVTTPTAVLDLPPPLPSGSAPAAVTQSPPAKGLKKVSFGNITKKKEETKTAYPLFPDPDGKAAEIAARIKERTEQFEALEGAIKTDKGEVLVTFQNRYSLLEDESTLLPILGEHTDKFFRQCFTSASRATLCRLTAPRT